MSMARSESLRGKRVLLIIGGGIAAYKCLEAIRRLREAGARVRVIVTRAGQEFVTPLSLATLSGEMVHTDLFDLTDEVEIGHIRLARDTDLVVVAPATANLIAKMANGIADDLATTALLATDKPVLIAPAMNTRMWEHPATRRNLARLLADGVATVGPGDGPLAEGESGIGRMAEPEEILAAIAAALGGGAGTLHGKKILVTSGPTHEAIDPVRYLANRSSGKQGHAVASALAGLGAEVVLISGPVSLADPPGVKTVHVESAQEMLAACEAEIPADAAVCAAAVADWRAEKAAGQKLKKEGKKTALSLVENPDILATLSRHKRHRPALVIGFAAETEKLIENARAKLKQKRCDWIVANDVSPSRGVMGGDDNRVHLVFAGGDEAWPLMSKEEVAARLAQRIASHLTAKRKAAE
ncbi:MAG: bifunctional phosphopantothenoylcysteine decarboxylase/phosphopantothenate--cysteine ligase CoaBC [Hyphomicrobiales bacterium]|nr:bifunctional phosphopantothenoylcysteine decarboxylase/phosphopantothenate--cysteine ligase CoaBC [Hyphomicrobiales bacterium]